MREALELYYPVIPKLFDSLSSQIALEFLQRWPDPQSLAKARASTLTDFFHQHRSRSQSRIDKRIELIGQSRALIKDPTLLEVQHMRLHDHINQIKALNKSIGQYDKMIKTSFDQHEKAALFNQLPGAAAQLAPRLLAAFCLINPDEANEMQTRVGIAPIRVQSGKSTKTFMRQQCPKFLRQTFHEFAGCSVNSSGWAKAFYEHQTKVKRCSPHAAKRALAYKWIRILVPSWKSNTPYNEMEYIAALQKRKSPLAELILCN